MKYLGYPALVISALLMCGFGQPQQGKVYSGSYFYNFESSAFTPDGTHENWCLSGDMSKAELPGKDGGSLSGTAHVVVRGVLSPPGHYCNLSASKYVLKVYEVLDAKDRRSEEK